jgi:hypothetical protein
MSSNRTYGPDCGPVPSETPCWRNNIRVAHDPEMNSKKPYNRPSPAAPACSFHC